MYSLGMVIVFLFFIVRDIRLRMKDRVVTHLVRQNQHETYGDGDGDVGKLVVGQEVYVFCESEVYGFWKGKVVKITSANVEVLVAESIIHFGYDGTELGVEPRKKPFPAFPWCLDYNMSFEERAAKIEHHERLWTIIKTLVVGQEVWMVSGPYIKGECFIKGKVVKLSPVVEVLESPYGDRKGGKLRRFCGDGTQSDGNRHPEFGPWRLDDMPFADRTALHVEAALRWRERQSEQIPLGARNVAVANTLDSITSDLPYSPARSLDVAREEIRQSSGSQFDPEVAHTFLSMSDKIWDDLRKAIQSDVQQNAHSAVPESSRTSDVIQMVDFVGSESVNTELDWLTNLRTPTAFVRDFERYLNDSNLGVALLVADFDHFKQVNDKYGHLTGDELLRALALLFIERCDLLGAVPYRFGSVFDVILPGRNSEAAKEIAESIRIAVEGFRYRDLALTVSIGMAAAPKDGRTIPDLADKAYAAMRRAKTNGRNRVEAS
jgi:diguanylate cyclase (GGDEF)-like protein